MAVWLSFRLPDLSHSGLQARAARRGSFLGERGPLVYPDVLDAGNYVLRRRAP